MTPKVIALIRTSTIQQEVESQKQEVVSMAMADGYSAENIIVVGGAGASAIKVDEQYQKNLNEVYNHITNDPSIKAVYAWAIDRIGRNEEILMQFKNFLINHQIQLKIKNPSLTLLDADGKVNAGMEIAFSLFATMAKQEMEQKKSRFSRGRKRNDEKGKYNGGYITFGYKVDENGYIVVCEEEAKVVRLVFTELAKGRCSCDALARELQERGILFRGKKMLYSNIRQILGNKIYCGEQVAPGGYVRNIPTIISKELYYQARAAVTANSSSLTNAYTNRHLLGLRLMVCPDCGAHYSVAAKLYQCHNHNRNYYDSRQGFTKCPNGISIRSNTLDRLIWFVVSRVHIQYLKALKAKQDVDITEQIEVIDQKIAQAQRNIDELAERRKRINEVYMDGDISKEDRDKKFAKLLEDKDKFSLFIRELEDEKASLIALKEGNWADEFYFDNLVSLFALEDDEKKVAIVRKHIKDIVMEKSEYPGYKRVLKITFKFFNHPDMQYLYVAKSLGEFFPLKDGKVTFSEEGKPISYKADWFFRGMAVKMKAERLNQIDRELDFSKPIPMKDEDGKTIKPKHNLTL